MNPASTNYVPPLQAQGGTTDFWGDLTAGKILGFANQFFYTDSEKAANALAQNQLAAGVAVSQSKAAVAQAQSRQTIQLALIGVGGLAVIAGGILAFRAMR